jgi:hypothetical protein
MTRKARVDGKHDLAEPHKEDVDDGAAQESDEPWDVVILEAAIKEGRKILSQTQYEHIVSILKRLVDFGNDEELSDLKIEQISSFWELKEKGGILGKINLRIFFGTIPEERELVVAKTYKKEAENQTPSYIIIAVEDRLEDYKINRPEGVAVVHQKNRGKAS